jgi:hypothetical protein
VPHQHQGHVRPEPWCTSADTTECRLSPAAQRPSAVTHLPLETRLRGAGYDDASQGSSRPRGSLSRRPRKRLAYPIGRQLGRLPPDPCPGGQPATVWTPHPAGIVAPPTNRTQRCRATSAIRPRHQSVPGFLSYRRLRPRPGSSGEIFESGPKVFHVLDQGWVVFAAVGHGADFPQCLGCSPRITTPRLRRATRYQLLFGRCWPAGPTRPGTRGGAPARGPAERLVPASPGE